MFITMSMAWIFAKKVFSIDGSFCIAYWIFNKKATRF